MLPLSETTWLSCVDGIQGGDASSAEKGKGKCMAADSESKSTMVLKINICKPILFVVSTDANFSST